MQSVEHSCIKYDILPYLICPRARHAGERPACRDSKDIPVNADKNGQIVCSQREILSFTKHRPTKETEFSTILGIVKKRHE